MNDRENSSPPPAPNPTTPEAAAEFSELARHADPSQANIPARVTVPGPGGTPRRGVVWVRPSELICQAGARVTGRGLDLQAELARRVRLPGSRPGGRSRGSVGARAGRLPPVSAFGRHGPSPSTPTRSGIGLR